MHVEGKFNLYFAVLVGTLTEAWSHNLRQLDNTDLLNQAESNIPHQESTSKIHMPYNSFDGIGVDEQDTATLDTWSVIWYIASFGGLIVFFLIVSCSEWCCRRNARRNFTRNSNVQSVNVAVPETPPPSYDQFAPPDYESLVYGRNGRNGTEKSKYDVFVVPVHALDTIMEEARLEQAPPSYNSARIMLAHLPNNHTSHPPT
ncbi:uncharacterized protein LOC132703260 [Cylas formicarius]|uniref:uncharacterized protein LOC132703260 n=1 Tax=Cylas formicarius TaxID=197179 RepID=UPI002958320F|nr:uncharacterized protein LOC132703260 [Cylas formicarius]